MFLRKGVQKICSKFTGEHQCRSVISRKFLCNFIENALRHGCSPVNLLHVFRTSFPRKTSGWLLLNIPLFCYKFTKTVHSMLFIDAARWHFTTKGTWTLLTWDLLDLLEPPRYISSETVCSHLLRLRETHKALPLTASSSPSSPSCSSCDFASVIRNIGKFGAKNHFTDHQQQIQFTVLEIEFRSLKYTTVSNTDTPIFEQHSILTQAIATRRKQCRCKQPISNSFETLKTVYTYSNCTINPLLYCWKSF